MSEPNYSIKFSARLVAAQSASVGNVMIPSATSDGYAIATAAERGTRRSEGIALSAYGGTGTGSINLQQAGTIDPVISGLAAGSASWVRCSATGTIERFTPAAGSSDVIGYAEADGRVHLLFGVLTESIITASGGGGGGAPTTAQYVTMALDGTLTAERVLTAGTGISITDGGANGNVTIANTGAPVGASYVTLGTDGTLTSERVLTAGSGISLTDNGAGSTIVVAATGGSFTPPTGTGWVTVTSGALDAASKSFPTGTGFVTATSGAVDAAATANIRYTGGKLQTDANIQWKNGANLGDVAWTPTAARTLTLPDATDTVVGRATTDTLTNKTINASNNTITDTSTASGDLLLSNGTKFVRLAKGGNSTVLTTSSGGTVQWATVSIAMGGTGVTSLPGSSGEFLINNGGALGASTNVTYGSTFVAIGASAGTSGALRFPLSGVSTVLIGGKAGAGTNDSIVTSNGFNLYFGEVTPANWTSNISGDPMNIWGKTNITMFVGAGGATAGIINSSAIAWGLPRLGNSTPYASEGMATIALSGSISLNASQYSRAILKFTGPHSATDTITFPAPATADASYIKFVRSTSTNTDLIFTTGTGTTGGISPAVTAMYVLFVSPDGINQMRITSAGNAAANP